MENNIEMKQLTEALTASVENSLRDIRKAKNSITELIDSFGSEELTEHEDMVLRKLGHYLGVVEGVEEANSKMRELLSNLCEPWGELRMEVFLQVVSFTTEYKAKVAEFSQEMRNYQLDSLTIGLVMGLRRVRLEQEV